MKNGLLFCFFTLCFTIEAYSQTIIRYKDQKGRVYTRKQLDSVLLVVNTRPKSVKFKALAEIKEKTQSGDTIFYKYIFNLHSIAGAEDDKQNENKKEQLLGKSLPFFELKNIKEELINSKNLIGKPVIINLWFTTCMPCIAEMPELNRLKEKYKNTDIVFLSMTFETKKAVTAFLKKTPFNFNTITDARAYCDLFTNSYPLNIFIDRDGIIQFIKGGMPFVLDEKGNLAEKVSTKDFEEALLIIK